MFLWNRIWSLSLVPAKPTKWLLYDEFMKNLMLWEERRVFTVSELSKVEQGGKIWFLFGSQGTWHTKCFYEEKKGRSGSEFSEISWFPFGCFTAVAFLGNSHFKEKFGAHSSHLPPFNRTCRGERRLGLPTASTTQRGPAVARPAGYMCWRHLWAFLQSSFFSSWAGNSRHWRIW